MQNQFLNYATKIFKSQIQSSNNLTKGFLRCSQQKYTFLFLSMHTESYDLNRNHSALTLLPGGGLGKLQGRFKEEQYFNANDHVLLDKLRQTGCRLKCESSDSDWTEFERMANACGTLSNYKNYAEESFFLQEQKSLLERLKCESSDSDWTEFERMANACRTLSNNKNYAEESFFLQEQKGLLERILDVLKRLILNRRSGPPMSYGPPYGGYYPPFGGPQYHHSPEEKKADEDKNEEDEKSKEDEEVQEGKEEGQEQNDADSAVEDKAEVTPEEKPFEEESYIMPPEESYEEPPDNSRSNGGGDERQ